MRMTQQNSPSIIQSFSLPLPSHTRTHTYEIMRLSIIPEGQLFECLGQCSSTKYKNSLFLSQDEIAEKCIIEKLQSIFCQNVLHVTNYALISKLYRVSIQKLGPLSNLFCQNVIFCLNYH